MHSPRLQQQHAAKRAQGGGAPPGGGVMSSAAVSDLVGRFHIDHPLPMPSSSNEPLSSKQQSSQEVARIAAICAPRKPVDTKAQPFQNVSSRVFDYMNNSKAVAPQSSVSGRLSPLSTAAPQQQQQQQPYHDALAPYLTARLPAITASSASDAAVAALRRGPLAAQYPSPIAVLTSTKASGGASSSVASPPIWQGALPMPPPQQGPLVRHQPHYQVPAGLSGRAGGPAVTHPPAAGSGQNHHHHHAPDADSVLMPVGQSHHNLRSLVLVPHAVVPGSALTIVQSPTQLLPPGPLPGVGGIGSESDNRALLSDIDRGIASSSTALIEVPTAAAAVATSLVDDKGALEAKRKERYGELLHTLDNGVLKDIDRSITAKATEKSRMELARLRNRIALLCQQALTLLVTTQSGNSEGGAAAGTELSTVAESSAAPHFEALLLEEGEVVWRSTSEDITALQIAPLAAPPSASAVVDGVTDDTGMVASADEAWLMGDELPISGDGGGSNSSPMAELDQLKKRARKAYSKAVAGFRAKIVQQRETIVKLKGQLDSQAPGGSKYRQLEEDLDIVRDECRKQMTKINTLVNLLDRAGQTIRFHEDQRHAEAIGNTIRKDNAAPWHQVRRIIPALDVEPPRTDAHILADVIRFMDSQEEKLTEYSVHVEQLTTQLEDAQNAYATLQKANKSAQRELDQTRYELEILKQRRRYEQDERSGGSGLIDPAMSSASLSASGTGGGDSSSVERRRSGSNQTASTRGEEERLKLVEKIAALESALKATTETNGIIQTMGVGLEVPPFLRCDVVQIRNLRLSKAAVENIICGIWLTRFLPSIQSSRPVVDARWLSAVPSQSSHDLTASSGDTTLLIPDFSKNGSGVVKSLERLFIIAVQSTFSSTAAAGGGVGVGSEASASTAATSVPLVLARNSDSDDNSSSSVLPPQLCADRHAACDFIDANNLSLLQVKRSEAKRMVNFLDHVTRFLVECIDPSACRHCFTLYTLNSGISTPPVAALQWQKKCDLFLQAPQFPSLSRPGVSLPTPVAEVAYSLIDGCEKYAFDGDVLMFRRVVQGEVPETAYFDMMLMIEKLRVAMINSHQLYTAPYRYATPTVATVLHTMRRFFTRKSSKAMATLQRCLLLDVKETTLNSDAAAVARMVRRTSAVTILGQPVLPDATATTEQTADTSAVGSSAISRFTSSEAKTVDLPLELVLVEFMTGSPTTGSSSAATITQEALRSPVDVARLFSATESGNQGHLLDAIKAQYMSELTQFTEEVQQCILASGEAFQAAQQQQQLSNVANELAMASDDQRQTTLERSKKRRASVATFFEQNAAASDGTGTGGQTKAAQVVSLQFLAERLQALDPQKPKGDIESYVFHLVQLHLLFKTRSHSSGGGGVSTEGLTSSESEVALLSRDELWKRQAKVSSFCVPVVDLAKFCPMVLFRRSGPEPPTAAD